MRFAGPLACFGIAAVIFLTLHATDADVPVLVGLDRLVGPSPEAQAGWTWRLFAAAGVVWTGALLWRRQPGSDELGDA